MVRLNKKQRKEVKDKAREGYNESQLEKEFDYLNKRQARYYAENYNPEKKSEQNMKAEQDLISDSKSEDEESESDSDSESESEDEEGYICGNCRNDVEFAQKFCSGCGSELVWQK